MSTWVYTAETGLADDTSVTAANSGDGSAGFAFDAVTRAGGGTVKYSSSSPLSGALSLQFGALVSGDVGRVDVTSRFSSQNIVLDIAFRTPDYADLGCRVVELLSGAGSVLRINIATNGKIDAFDAANALIWTSSVSVSTATSGWRIGIRCVAGTSTTDGRLEVSYYDSYEATSPAESMTTITNGNFGTQPLTQLRVGKITSAPVWAAMYTDDIQISDDRTTLFGAPPGSGGGGSSWVYTAETGLANGTDVTTANSDDGSAGFAFDAVTKAGGGTVKYSTSNPLRGALSLQFGAPVTNDVGRVDMTALFSSTNIVLDIAFRTPNYADLGCRIVELLSGTGSVLRINISTSGKIEAYNAANALVWTSTASVSTATTGWRIGIRCVAGTSTTNGRLEISYYSSYANTTPAESMTTITNGNFGTVAITQLRVGKITSAPVWTALYADDFQISDDRTTLFGSPPSGSTVSAGSDQANVEPWTTVTLSATSPSDTVTWSHVSGPAPTLSGTGLTRTFTAPADFAAQTSVFRATDGTATDDVSISYLPATDGIVVSTGPVVVTPIRIVRKT